ncbi:multiple sugar transport system substrate-binding protein [Saccharothrix saharensis]|uniref:Multiple sugar transport system substrate-binding protein n=1 Tax=Saccharothrix saharensis TaxID=571190 RepID=A0A543JC98_9PSEU|nr:extracellular solute-binding protein [Saccharothrix saharensis]TQM80401.1 multiple sugar transport system substrate-binding protein [Saccharothrix saharensis]
MIRVLVPLVVLLAACTTPVRDDAADGTGPITFVDGLDTTAHGRVRELVDRWNEQASRREQVVFVEMPTSTDAHRAQLTARGQDLRGGRGSPDCYDVMAVDMVWTVPFAAAGHLEPLDPAEFGVDRMLPEAVNAARSPDGRTLWAVPWRSDAGLLYYRKDVLEEEGVAPPTTWEEMRRQAIGIAPKHGLQGFVGQFRRYEGLIVNAAEAVWAHGGDLERLDAAETKAGVQALADGFAQGWIPSEARDYDENGSLEAFRSDRALFMRNWPYAGPVLETEVSKVVGEWGRVALPWPSALGGWNLAVSRCSAHQRTAREFIKFLTRDDNQRRMGELAGWAPTTRALYEEPGLVPRELRDSLLNARIRRPSPHYDELTGVMQESLHHVLENPDSVDQSLGRLADDLVRAAEGR